MKILVFSWRDPKHPLAGGAEQVMHEHMKGWVKAGHQVTLFSSWVKGLSKEEAIDGVYIVRQGYQYIGVQLSAFLYYLKNRKKYDFVVDQFHGLPFFTPIYVKKPKLAVIQETAREVWFLNPLPRPLSWLVGVLGFLGEPFIFLFYKKVPFMTGSLSAKLDVSKFGISSRNIHVVQHGVVVKKISVKTFKEKKFTIAFLGVLSKDKGVEDALKCFKLLKERGGYQFWVIGKPETEKYWIRIKRVVSNLGLEKEVKFWGFVSQEKKFQLLSKAHVLLNPSVREGWGLVNIEANRMGTPVIAYRSAGLIDSVKDNSSGIICKANNPKNMGENVIRLLSNQVRYKKFQKEAISWSQNFSWEHSSGLSLKLLNKIYNLSSLS